MSLVTSIALIILFVIALLIFKIAILPQIQLKLIKKKYGDEVETIFHYGSGLLIEVKRCLDRDGDSLSYFRKLLIEKPNVKAIVHNNSRGKISYSFIDPELIKQVHQQSDCFAKEVANPSVIYLFSQSILFLQGKDWQKQRQFLGKSFHFDEIRNYLPTIKEISSNVFSKINNELQSVPQQEIQVVKTCEKITSEVVFKVFFGASSENLVITRPDGSKLPLAHELVSCLEDSFRLIQGNKYVLLKFSLFKNKTFTILPTKEEKQIMQRLKTLKQVCNDVVFSRKKELIENPTLYKQNFLDLYLKEIIVNKNEDIKEEYIVDNFLGLFFAGTDTTGNMTGVALYYLSMHPDIQKQAREEVINLLTQKCKSKDRNEIYNSLSFEDIQNLNLINAVLKESLRLIPPAATVFPRRALKDIQIGNFSLKKGDPLNTSFISNQSNPRIFNNPENFDPSRWLNAKEQNQFNFTPFSLGPRNCIGQHLAMIEGKCMLAYVLLNFEILPNHAQPLRKEIKMTYGVSPDNLVFFKKLQ